jgi:hypothetical protein
MPSTSAVYLYDVHITPEDVDDRFPLSHAGDSDQSVHELKRINSS